DQLRHIILLRSLELSLDEISSSQNSFDDNLDDVLHISQNNHKQIKEKIKYFERVNEKTDLLIDEFERYKNSSKTIKIKRSPDMQFASSSEVLNLKELTKNFHSALNEHDSIPKSAFIIKKESLLKEDFDSSSYIQFGVLIENETEAMHDAPVIKSKTCAYSMYSGSLNDMRDKYRDMLNWIEENEYVIADDAIEVCNFSVGDHYFFEIYIPVDKRYRNTASSDKALGTSGVLLIILRMMIV